MSIQGKAFGSCSWKYAKWLYLLSNVHLNSVTNNQNQCNKGPCRMGLIKKQVIGNSVYLEIWN